jgi:hypothetical protein
VRNLCSHFTTIEQVFEHCQPDNRVNGPVAADRSSPVNQINQVNGR